MKYFTQYLPVDEEIEQGDTYFNGKIELRDTSISKDKILVADIPESYSNPHVGYYDGFKKVEIFLCSTDIRIGDKYQYFNMGKIWDDIATEDIIFLLLNPAPPFKPYKVLGEKSPAATWVTADMEFEESDIKRTANIGEFDTEIDPLAITVLFKDPTDGVFK